MLSHPLLVEAIENEFTPVAIYNNKKGRDAEILKRYAEKSWNNPVVRFVDVAGKDIIARRDGIWSPDGVAARMVEALGGAKRPVPGYLKLLAVRAKPKFLRKASFAMY